MFEILLMSTDLTCWYNYLSLSFDFNFGRVNDIRLYINLPICGRGHGFAADMNIGIFFLEVFHTFKNVFFGQKVKNV